MGKGSDEMMDNDGDGDDVSVSHAIFVGTLKNNTSLVNKAKVEPFPNLQKEKKSFKLFRQSSVQQR